MRAQIIARRTLLPVLILLPILASCVSGAAPEGWTPPLQTDGNEMLISLDKGELSSVILTDTAPALINWTFPNDGRPDEEDLNPEAIYPVPIVANGIIFVATHREGVFALDAATGAVVWRRNDLGGDIIGAFAETESGQLVVGTVGGQLHMLEPASGGPAPGWPAAGIPLESEIWATIVVSGSTVYVATMDGRLMALDESTSQQVWTRPFEAGGAILELALLPDGQLFVPSLDGNVYLVSSATGNENAKIPTDDWVWMQPAVGDGVAYFGDLGGGIYALDITSRQLKWQTPSNPGDGLPSVERIKAQPALVGDKLIVVDRAPSAHFLNPADGQRVNRVAIDGKTVRAPVVESAGTGLILSTNGRLFRANPQALSVVQIPIGSSQ